MPKPPASVKVGPHTHKVDVNAKRANDASITFGQFDHVTGDIIVNPNQGSTQLQDTVLHEVVHAICDVQSCQAGGEAAIFADDAHEERSVRAFTPWLLTVLRDNPDLTSFLLAP